MGTAHDLARSAWLVVLAGCSLFAPSDEDLSLKWGAADASVTACAPGTKRCGDACVSTESPSVGCGAVDCAPCRYDHGSALCIAGACALGPCESGHADCNNRSEDGCETDTRVSTSFCGSCGVSCGGTTPLCDEGVCVAKCHAVKFSSTLARLHFPWNGPELLDGDFTLELWGALHDEFVTPLNQGWFLTTNERELQPTLALLHGDDQSLVLSGYNAESKPAIGIDGHLSVPKARQVPSGSYFHLAGVRQGNVASVYYDGALVATTTIANLQHVTLSDLAFGHTVKYAWTPAAPTYLGPTRISRVARYTAPFRPKWRRALDEHTVVQFLTHTAFDGVKLVDESGNGSHALHDRDVVAAEKFTPCME